MKTLKFITFLFLISTKVVGQTLYDSDIKDVFKSFIEDKRQVSFRPSIGSYYVKKLNQYPSANSFHRTITYAETVKTISDTLLLTKIERLYIDSCIQSFNSFRWTDYEKEKCGLEKFNLLSSNSQKKIPDFDYIVYSIAKPIFIRQSSICFLFYVYACGNLCGHEELTILKKQDNDWVKWWTIFHSDS